MDDDYSDDVRPQRSSALPWVLLFVVLILAGAAGYFGYSTYLEEHSKVRKAQQAGEDAAKRAKELEAKVSALEEEKGSLAANLAQKEEELAKLKSTYEDLNDKLQDEIKKGEISLTQQGDKLQVEMVDKVLFDSGQAEVSARGQEVLARLGSAIANVENKLIQVSGHTDDSPPKREVAKQFPTNWELSAARAVNVVRYLAESAGVPTKRLVAAGYGQYHPVVSNHDAPGRARNRRIEIVLTPAMDVKDVKDEAAAAEKVDKVVPAKATKPAKAKATKAKRSRH